MTDRDADASRLAADAMDQRDPTGWFERLYREAAEGNAVVPWDRDEPNPLIVERLAKSGRPGLRALVVGCGYGTDAEYVASLGYDTTAFDISSTAVEAARTRFPDSLVSYEVADMLDMPTAWASAFDLVVESITVQSMPVWVRVDAISAIASTVAPAGTLCVVSGIRADGAEVDGPPWPLTRDEILSFGDNGLSAMTVERVPSEGRWWAQFIRMAAGEWSSPLLRTPLAEPGSAHLFETRDTERDLIAGRHACPGSSSAKSNEHPSRSAASTPPASRTQATHAPAARARSRLNR
ncbi:bifunctional 2-polyprenyl-6-hydroxyphenol methylase/3-demethylubiquinol 3-O-methyltransferase UbiG [Rhodococcus sp. SORGH_AS_0301]|uniref:class I SAM-dependent methyltransferase n=1 Tax=Rhodococcus sp. SORGH_AS_0301 TaxID=3041780 RepID=UPI002781AC3A|nr:class I SAM-dependent methyltransferase [Rhodococcus sp. SORGH_AS_0301]MDQ1179211.1 SAM-dependent methyltransferase [Rhodococcus sp. SORGH_AS_0301]